MDFLRSGSAGFSLSLGLLVSAGVQPYCEVTASSTSSALISSSTSTSCITAFIGDGYCDSEFNSEECVYDCGEFGYSCIDPEASCVDDDDVTTSIALNCEPMWYSDGKCDPDNNNELCGYDGGDCCSCTCASGGYYECGEYGYACIDPGAPCVDDDDVTTSIAINCGAGYISNGVCDSENNNELCGYDGGDCCSCTCTPGGEFECGEYGYACIDPEASCVDDDDVTTSMAFNCVASWFSDGICDLDNNNELCGYDGGDCCSCTCAPGGYFECGESGYACIDPGAPCVDDDDVTPSIAINCIPSFFSDGECDPDNNSEVCGYDGGDCCSCTCVPGGYFECGESGYSCIDPEAPCVDDDEDVTTPVACVPALDSDGFCDDDNNNDLCGYDGGDCCSCTCASGGKFECGEAGYACKDPEASCVDPSSAAQSLTGSTAACIATFTAALGVMRWFDP